MNRLGRYSRFDIAAHWYVLGLLVIAHAVFDALLTPFGRAVSSCPMMVAYPVIGVMAIQPALFAMWAALRRQPFLQRIIPAGLACVAVAFAGGLGEIRHASDHPISVIAENIAIMSAYFALATLVFWIVGRIFRWQVIRGNAESSTSEPLGDQFGIGHLLTWTAISAGMLGLARFLGGHVGSHDAASPWQQPMGQVAIMAAFFLVVLLPIVVIPWITLAYSGRGKLLLLAAILGWGGLTYGCIVVMVQMFQVTFPEIAQPVILIQLGAGVAGLLSALIVRFCGFRITRY